jgi:holo-[acyl-carrier protein] synthase
MITGVGTDIISIERIEYAVEAFGTKFMQRILTLNERNYLIEIHNDENKIAYLAKRFAAKEAISKALGTGIGESLSFQDIEISNNALGKPIVSVAKFPDINIHLSLSDEKEGFAIAFAVAEKI